MKYKYPSAKDELNSVGAISSAESKKVKKFSKGKPDKNFILRGKVDSALDKIKRNGNLPPRTSSQKPKKPNDIFAAARGNASKRAKRRPPTLAKMSWEENHEIISFKEFILESFLESSDDFQVTHEGWHGAPDARGIHKDGFKTLKQRHNVEDHNTIYWAAKDRHIAKSYADPHRAMDYQNSEPATLPVQMQMKNPKVIDWGGRAFRGKDKDGTRYAIDDHIQQARKDGHDGFVIHRVIDNYDAKGKPSTIMGVFHNKNIRVKK
tara:strand:- start:47 stop:838 length:792 start_codon:yes stop_codon:yes gene_type:complete